MDMCNLQLPELPSILGSRRGSALPSSPDANERLDLLVKGATQSKDVLGFPDGKEKPFDFAPEEVKHTKFLNDPFFSEQALKSSYQKFGFR